MYPIEYSVWSTVAATLELPLAPTPVGHSTVLPAPMVLPHSVLTIDRYVVNQFVVPEPSDL